ncbi:uncharacterized protein LOC131650646 [Vicia villosa]|uniref:uncharacterized protein LOC131650646 n=1 Tax=Vicia villosa TaxID=3911 RepID=UPI00273C91B2|nr:uncharacterized protein LOC131650646 [Vicia villosa]
MKNMRSPVRGIKTHIPFPTRILPDSALTQLTRPLTKIPKPFPANMSSPEGKRLEEELSYPILVAERVRSAIEETDSFKLECSEVWKQVERLLQMLRTVVRIAATSPLYERPVRRVTADTAKNLERALTLVRKCKRRSILHRVVTIVGVADFRKVLSHLDASVGDMKWLLSILDGEGGVNLALPPIASNDPILSWVWSFIASIQMGQLNDKIEAANELASLAQDNDRYQKIIVEEQGVPPLLKLLKEAASPAAQIAAATCLCHLANDLERVRVIVNEVGVPAVVQVLADSPIRVQTLASNLVARMARHDPVAQEDFARENAIRPLVTLLSMDTTVDEQPGNNGRQSIHSIFQINKELGKKTDYMSGNGNSSSRQFANSYSNSYYFSEGSGRGGNHRKERENVDPVVKLQLKISCAEALWMLAAGSVSNSRKITETKGMLCLAKIIEKEQGELQQNCLMTIMEITAAAESNADLRRAAFKTNSPPAKAVVEQLLRIIKEVDSPSMQIPAIKSIGSLARTFPARETRVIEPLVAQLSNRDMNVADEAAIALTKFACPDNFLYIEHSKKIIEFNAVPAVMKLLRNNDVNQMYHGLTLLCYLALHAGSSESLEQARVLLALEGADKTILPQHIRDLVSKAIVHLNLYHAGRNSQPLSYMP